jgi:hypothetical protein
MGLGALMTEARKWVVCDRSMGVRLPDGRDVLVRRGDRILSSIGANGIPVVQSVMIQIASPAASEAPPAADLTPAEVSDAANSNRFLEPILGPEGKA